MLGAISCGRRLTCEGLSHNRSWPLSATSSVRDDEAVRLSHDIEHVSPSWPRSYVASRLALPPTAVVSMHAVRSFAKRSR
jgi:hypothetical protein